jgi:polysaccharide export outer membrane protein
LQVRPDGKISVMFAPDVDAVGKTPEELAAVLKQRLASHLNQLDLVVVMKSFASQKVFVGGEVAKPGMIQLIGGETLLQVLSEAGWVTPFGRTHEVVLLRRGADGNEAAYVLDVTKIVSGEDTTHNVIVQAGDQILVPPSEVTSFDRWIDQYIREALPLNTSAVITNDWRVQ